MKILVTILLVCLLFAIVAISCAPVVDYGETGDTANMVLVAQRNSTQVWRFYDGSTVCYVTINNSLKLSAGIYCK